MADDMTHTDEHNPEIHHEESDINVRAVLIGTAIVAVFFVVTAVGLWAMYVGFRGLDRKLDPEAPTRIAEPTVAAPGASDYTSHWSEPAEYLEKLREEDRKIMEEYGWTDRSTGLVHVPIEVGMKLALEQGYPTRPAQEASAGTGDATPHDPWVLHPARAIDVAAPEAQPSTAEHGTDPMMEETTEGPPQ